MPADIERIFFRTNGFTRRITISIGNGPTQCFQRCYITGAFPPWSINTKSAHGTETIIRISHDPACIPSMLNRRKMGRNAAKFAYPRGEPALSLNGMQQCPSFELINKQRGEFSTFDLSPIALNASPIESEIRFLPQRLATVGLYSRRVRFRIRNPRASVFDARPITNAGAENHESPECVFACRNPRIAVFRARSSRPGGGYARRRRTAGGTRVRRHPE